MSDGQIAFAFYCMFSGAVMALITTRIGTPPAGVLLAMMFAPCLLPIFLTLALAVRFSGSDEN